jgi:Ice-binding-like
MLSKTRNRPHFTDWANGGRLRIGLVVVIALAALAWPLYDALAAQSPVDLGTAGSFAVLAGSAVTNTGASTVNGDLGVSPGTSVTGFPPGTVNGTTADADAVASQAQSDLTTAYNDAAGRTPALSVSGDLGGLTLTPGVYNSGSSLGLTGVLTLDAQGDPSAVFIFQLGSALTTASASDVKLINGAQACNVYWQIGSSATLGTASVFAGNILAETSISMNDDVTVHGRALAQNGAVTLIDDTVTTAQCAAGTGTTPTGTTPTGTGTGTTPTGTTPTGTTPTGTGTTPTGTTPTGTGTGPGKGKGPTGTAILRITPPSVAKKVQKFGTSHCVRGTFRVSVTGLFIRRVVFSLGKELIATRSHSPFTTSVASAGGIRTVNVRITFTDGARAATLHMRFKACAAAKRPTPPPSPPVTTGGFTG